MTEHTFLMASAPEVFRIKYEPQIFTIHIGGKKKQNLKAGLQGYLDKLEQLDIKCVAEFLPGTTTVAVVTKRNLPVSLRALINGAWIVTSNFVDAIVEAAAQPKADDGDLLDSPLQLDITSNWPDPITFLPPPGQEPNPKPPEYFKPNPKRKTMFEKWAVVSCTQQHMDIFTGVVTDGGGKIELFDLKENKTKPSELFAHLDNLGRKFIVLAPNTDGDWYLNFRKEVEARTGLRFAEQNEFLDAILNADPNMLCRPCEPEVQTHESIELPSAPPVIEVPIKAQPVARRTRAHDQDADNDDVTQEPDPPTRASTESSLRSRTQPTQSRSSRYISQIKIDDSDEEDFVPLPAPVSTNVSAKGGGGNSQSSKSRGVSFSQAGMRGTQLSAITESQGQSQGIKRRGAPPDDDDEGDGDIMDRMLTGQAAMKKRRIDEEEAKQAGGSKRAKVLPSFQKKADAPPLPPPLPVKTETIKEEEDMDMEMKPGKGKKKAVESKVIKTAQEIRRKEEAKAALEDAANEMSPDEIAAVAKMRGLAIVETFEIVARTERSVSRSQAYGDEGARWDERWNGRKNFKKFKRRTNDGSLEGPMRRMGGHIMVPLVEHKAKDYGIGESYWLESSAASSKKRGNQSSHLSHVSETQLLLGPGSKNSRVVPEIQTISDEEDDFPEEEETARDDSHAAKRSQPTRSQVTGSRAPTQSAPSQARGTTRSSVRNTFQSTAQSSTARSKRTAINRNNSVSDGPARKKTKTKSSMFNDSDEDSDEDELKFKFK
ncbi:hypothetical protein ABW20_dc0105321 [Dactylellina cionopaga]|nr:hypothetical protein ABW20_dc0105321 [Dactylellina cionopaga]